MQPVLRGPSAAASSPAPAASVDVATVRQRFNWDWAINQTDFAEADTYWWYACSIRVDPDEVWAEDEDGDLWVIPFSTDGVDTITFGTPVRSRLTAVPVSAPDGQAASAVVSRRRQQVVAANLDRPEKPGRNPAAASAGPDNERTPMDDNVRQALARQHGLDPETATEEQVNAAVIAAAAADAEPETPSEPGTPAGAPAPAPEAEPEPEETPAPEPQPAAAAAERTVTVDRAQWEQTQRDAAAGAQVARQNAAAELDRLVDAAVQDGRIAPSSRSGWRAAVDPGENPDTAATARAQSEREALANLAAGRVPVDPSRTTAAATASSTEEALLAVSRARMGHQTPKEA